MKTILLILSLLSFSCIAQEEKKGIIKVKKVAKDTTFTGSIVMFASDTAVASFVIRNWIVIAKPEFPGGDNALARYIKTNLVYPPTKKTYKNGFCDVSFQVNPDGSITDVKVSQELAGCPECGATAIRMVKLMPKWKPAVYAGKPAVPYLYDLPIEFTFK